MISAAFIHGRSEKGFEVLRELYDLKFFRMIFRALYKTYFLVNWFFFNKSHFLVNFTSATLLGAVWSGESL